MRSPSTAFQRLTANRTLPTLRYLFRVAIAKEAYKWCTINLKNMNLELYQEMALIQDIPEYEMYQGDIATPIDFIPHSTLPNDRGTL